MTAVSRQMTLLDHKRPRAGNLDRAVDPASVSDGAPGASLLFLPSHPGPECAQDTKCEKEVDVAVLSIGETPTIITAVAAAPTSILAISHFLQIRETSDIFSKTPDRLARAGGGMVRPHFYGPPVDSRQRERISSRDSQHPIVKPRLRRRPGHPKSNPDNGSGSNLPVQENAILRQCSPRWRGEVSLAFSLSWMTGRVRLIGSPERLYLRRHRRPLVWSVGSDALRSASPAATLPMVVLHQTKLDQIPSLGAGVESFAPQAAIPTKMPIEASE